MSLGGGSFVYYGIDDNPATVGISGVLLGDRRARPIQTTMSGIALSDRRPGYPQQLGCCDDAYGALGELGLGACPGGPTVVVEDNTIPMWVWLVAAGWGLMMLLKKR